jgi:hypothetical protein
VVSLVGVGLGLPIAFAGYVLARWPQALRGSLDYEEPPAHTRNLQRTLGHMAAVGCTLLGLVKVFWALGATAGLDPAGLAERDLWWHMLTLSTGAWALAGAWSMLALTTRRGGTRFRPPMIVAWVSSGMLFSYNVFAAMRGDFQASPEHPLARALTTQAGIVLGVLMLLIVLLVVHDRRTRASARRWVSARIGNG